MAKEQGLLFDDRFMSRHAGAIIADPAIAIVELVANAWDAWATGRSELPRLRSTK